MVAGQRFRDRLSGPLREAPGTEFTFAQTEASSTSI
jgi:hypothetical protein